MKLPSKEFWKVFKKTGGAFSTPEAIALYNIALQAPKGKYFEAGSHKGKSGMSASIGLKEGIFYMIDPIYEDNSIALDVVDTLVLAGTASNVHIRPINGYSLEEIPKHDDYSYVFIDSSIHDDMVMEEVKMLEERVIPNGIIAFHDYLNQFTAVERAFNYLLSTGKYEKINIDWKGIFDYVREHNLEEGNISWHERGSEEFPKFVGALKRK